MIGVILIIISDLIFRVLFSCVFIVNNNKNKKMQDDIANHFEEIKQIHQAILSHTADSEQRSLTIFNETKNIHKDIVDHIEESRKYSEESYNKITEILKNSEHTKNNAKHTVLMLKEFVKSNNNL